MAVPNTFATDTTPIPLSQLDANFAYYDSAFSISGTSITFPGTLTLSGGTANGVAYLNGSKVLTTGSALTFDGTKFVVGSSSTASVLTAEFTKGAADPSFTLGFRNGSGASASTEQAVLSFNYGGTQIAGVGFVRGGGANAEAITFGLSSEQMRLTTTGLGIGTSSPTSKLVVSNAGALGLEFDPASGAMQVYNRSTSAYGTMNLWANTLYFRTGASPAINMALDVSGNLGIGTSSPAQKLDVSGNINFSGNVFGAIGSGYWVSGNNTYGAGIYGDGSTGNVLRFQASGSEQMRLTSTGLGIGTSSPGYKLDVSGAGSGETYQIRVGASNSNTSFTYNLGRSTVDGYFRFYGNQTGYVGYIFGGVDGERMRLDSSGNLGLGVTPSAWLANGRMEIPSSGGFFAQGAVMDVGTNWYYGSGGFTYKTTAAAAWYQQNSGAHKWFTAPSGTAGNAISFTQAMTLDASGRLGIGTTSPSQLLHVSGNSPRIYLSDVSTGSPIIDIGSGGGSFYIGSDNSTGSAFSTSAYARLLWGVGAYPMVFATNNTERARIDSSGNLLVGTTATNSSLTQGFNVFINGGSTQSFIGHVSGTASGTYYAGYSYNGTLIGSITQSGTTAVLYNVTSDQRLKENIVDAPEFGSVIDSMRVRSYDWKADGSHQRYGFVAQELVTVAPEAVHQPADPEEMMAVDYSKLVPMLVKEVQSLRARVAQLESN